MKIEMDIGNLSSIGRAIGKLKHIKKQLRVEIRIAFLVECCTWLQTRANEYLAQSSVGEAIKSEIMAGWEISQSLSGATLTNNSEHAVYVEFGVGIVGQKTPHPNSDDTGYMYNVPSEAKAKYGNTGKWVFPFSDESGVDLPLDKYQVSGKGDKKFVITYGTNGAWYAYNALTDLATNPQNLKLIWNKVLSQYLG
jgi:hypothetical protein